MALVFTNLMQYYTFWAYKIILLSQDLNRDKNYELLIGLGVTGPKMLLQNQLNSYVLYLLSEDQILLVRHNQVQKFLNLNPFIKLSQK